MIDTHCHLYKEYYSNLDGLIKNLKEHGIKRIIINGIDMKSNKEVIELTKKYDNVYGALGFYPSECDKVTIEDFLWLENHIKLKKIVAIGEIGLDYYYNKESSIKQIELFETQMKIAEKYNKPVIVHCRESFLDTYNIVKKFNCIKVLHCYSGSYEMAQKFIQCNSYFGVGGVLTFKNANNIKNVIKKLPINKILLETDSPYLSPEPNRGKVNSPLNLKYVVDEISNQKNLDKSSVINETTKNANSIFDF